MEKERLFTTLRIAAEIIAAVVVTMLGVGLFCWFAGCRHYPSLLKNHLLLHLAIGGMGLFTYLGNRRGNRSFSKRNTKQTTRGGSLTSINQLNDVSNQSNRPAMIMLIAGVILFIIGSQVQGLP